MSNKEKNLESSQNTIKHSTFDEVRKFDNEQLRNLLKEVKEIGKQDSPRYFKKSEEMNRLIDIEKADYYSWFDQFSNVQRSIEFEILWRVRTDLW